MASDTPERDALAALGDAHRLPRYRLARTALLALLSRRLSDGALDEIDAAVTVRSYHDAAESLLAEVARGVRLPAEPERAFVNPETVREQMADRLIAWLKEAPRRAPAWAFTRGPERTVAYVVQMTLGGEATPAPSDGERERLAEWCDSRAVDAGLSSGTGRQYQRIAALLRQPGAPEADECVRCGAATCRGAKLATVCEDCRAAPPREPSEARSLVLRQAEDAGLWFRATTAAEAYLQQALRELHRVVEVETGGETFGAARGAPQEGGGA